MSRKRIHKTYKKSIFEGFKIKFVDLLIAAAVIVLLYLIVTHLV